MEAIEALLNRRSAKKYKKDQIKEADLKKILEAGTFAPTGKGLQSPCMVVVQDEETVKMLSAMNAAVMGVTSDPFYGAPTVVIVFADKTVPTYIQDGSLVMGNMLNAAYALGLDGCWINRAKQMFETEEGRKLMEKWGVPETYEGIANCILGYGVGEYPQAKPRKDHYIIWA